MKYKKGKPYLTPKEVEDNYSIKLDTLAHWRCQGKGPRYFKLSPKMVRYRPEDLESFMKQHLVRTVDQCEDLEG